MGTQKNSKHFRLNVVNIQDNNFR